jgi:hypothetical protein
MRRSNLVAFTVASAIIALTALLSAAPAEAGPEPCSVTYVTAEGNNALNCQNGTGNNDFLNPLAVNTQNFFGFNDWQIIARQPDNEVDTGKGLAITGVGGTSGTWSVNAGALSSYANFMIVLKAGTQWAGFLFNNPNADNGTWGYPTTPGLSHLSLYARGTSAVPEPSAMTLLGAGLAALWLARRRKIA